MSGQQIGTAVAVRPGNRRWVSGRRFRVVLCASGMCFMIMLDSNIVAVSLPSIARDPGAAFSDIEWVVSAYVLTFAALLMPSGALTVGLAIVALGNIATAALVAADESYAVIAIGMMVTGCGAGLLNGKTARVSMSAIPPERGGMASGISGTLRFIGLVTGASGTQTRGTGLHSADKNDCQKRSKRGNAAGDDQHGGAGWRGVSPARRGTDRGRPMASGHVQNVEVFCTAFSFSPIQAWGGRGGRDCLRRPSGPF
jgi:MFS family permease